jgi:hypothetical protein
MRLFSASNCSSGPLDGRRLLQNQDTAFDVVRVRIEVVRWTAQTQSTIISYYINGSVPDARVPSRSPLISGGVSAPSP